MLLETSRVPLARLILDFQIVEQLSPTKLPAKMSRSKPSADLIAAGFADFLGREDGGAERGKGVV